MRTWGTGRIGRVGLASVLVLGTALLATGCSSDGKSTSTTKSTKSTTTTITAPPVTIVDTADLCNKFFELMIKTAEEHTKNAEVLAQVQSLSTAAYPKDLVAGRSLELMLEADNAGDLFQAAQSVYQRCGQLGHTLTAEQTARLNAAAAKDKTGG